MAKIRLGVLLSGSGTTLQNIIDRIRENRLDASVEMVIASRPDLKGTLRAQEAHVPNCVVRRKDYADVDSFSRDVFARLDEARVDLICLAGWLCLLNIPDRYLGRIMNIHPSLLPSFGGKGMYGHFVHEAVLAHGCKISGCSVHFVDNTFDTGPIILQRTCPAFDSDTPDTLAARVFEQEKIAYPEAIALFQAGRLTVHGRVVRVRS